MKLGSLRYWSGRIRRETGEALNEAVTASEVRIARVRTKTVKTRTEVCTRPDAPAA